MPDETPIQTFERALAASAGNASLASQPPEIQAVWAFTGIEVALAREPVPQRSLGRVWKDRRGSRATPLLVVAPAGEAGKVAVVGPADEQPIRAMNPETLAIEIARLRNESAIRAGRAIEESLQRLFDEAVPGVQIRGLLTRHYVRSRLARHRPDLHGRIEEAAKPAAGKIDWREVLEALGYTVVDYGGEGYVARISQSPVILIHAKRGAIEFGRIDENGRLPEGALVAACQKEHIRWGMMVTGSRVRLFEAYTDRGSATDRWIDLDLAALGESERYLVGLLAPASLDESGVWRQLIEDARTFGGQLKERLDEQVRRFALPNIARGLGEWIEREGRGDLDDPEVRRGIQQATNTLLFRLLFILYAESAGHLPIDRSDAYRDNALYRLGRRARENRDRASDTPTLWKRMHVLVRAIRDGDKAMSLPQYNGSLFAPDDLPGARLLEDAEVADRYLAPALEALAFDFDGDDDAGLDYTDLDIGHIGSIYEGLLALRLSRADQSYTWDQGKDRYVPSEKPGDYGVEAGQLFFQTEAGGRKGGGVYYTRQEFVRHLVNHSVLPALEEHLQQVQRLATNDVEAATRLIFRFRVLDPAMGSGHFLVDALDVIAEHVQRFLAEVPLPPLRGHLEALRAEAGADVVDDAQLLKRLLLKHCIYGVDLQEMAVELARVALWLSSFVPGLALSYLDQNLKRGDSLVGVASVDVVLESSGKGTARAFWGLPGGPLDRAIAEAGRIAAEIADLSDRTKAEVQRSRELRAQLEEGLAGVRRLFDLWTAEPFGVKGARAALLQGDQIIDGEPPGDLRTLLEQAQAESARRSFFHWAIEFPEVFHRGSERNPGFDAVIGNPPWDELRTDEREFFAVHSPGIRALVTHAAREQEIYQLLQRFPRLRVEYDELVRNIRLYRTFFRPENGYVQQTGGDADLYQLFCERYATLTRAGGRLGVVLPRSTFLTIGGRRFRRWLFRECQPIQVDFLLNSGQWAFAMEPRYAISLLTVIVGRRQKGGVLTITGPSASEEEFRANAYGGGVSVSLDDLAAWTPSPADDPSTEPSWELPLLLSPKHAQLFGKLRRSPRFDEWARQHGGVFAVFDLMENRQKELFQKKSGVAVWKGRSFEQYDPHGTDPAGFGSFQEILDFVQNKRIATKSSFAAKFPTEILRNPQTHPIHRARLAFRDVTNRTNSRTMISCLVPPRTPLVNSAPSLVFPSGDLREEAYLLGVFNSLPFDWQARRFVETHVNFYILNMLCLPEDQVANVDGIAERAARLSCPDKRFAEFAEAIGVSIDPLSDEEFQRLRAEIDALVAHAYGIDARDLETVFEDFTLSAVPQSYRQLVLDKFAEFSAHPTKAGA